MVDTTSGTQTGSTLGTRIYMSPEQVKDPKRVGTASDVYSLAVTFVHLISGKAPYDSTTSSDYEITVSIVTQPVDVRMVPTAWQAFLTPYLNKEPSQRPPLKPFDALPPIGTPDAHAAEDETNLGKEETSIVEDEATVMTSKNEAATPQTAHSTKPSITTPEGTTSKKNGVKGTTSESASSKGNSSERTSSKGTPPERASSTRTASERASSEGTALEKASAKGAPAVSSSSAAGSSSTASSSSEGGKNKKGLWIGIAAIAAAILLAVLLLKPKQQPETPTNPVKENPDEQTYLACKTVNDYREYIAEYGRNAQYYAEAKKFVDNYVADSTAKAVAEAEKDKAEAEKKEEAAYKECTTIAACQSYLSSYPNGRYVKEVKKKLDQLEKATQQAQQPTQQTPQTSQQQTSQQTQQPSRPATQGAFSVSANQKVKFAPGNVQYQASSNQWRFAPNPWSVVGEGNKNISDNYSGWIDLFGFGTGDDPTKTSRNADYTRFNDWGKHFKGGWRTLTKDEWVYVFHNRNTESGARFAKAKVNGVDGVILLPDDWDVQNYELRNTNNGAYNYGVNKISATDWNNIFQPNGAAFLPTTYWRSLTNEGDIEFQNMGDVGIYWSSTPYDNDFIYSVTFGGAGIVYDEHEVAYRYFGFAVRLVQPIKEQ